MARNKTKHTEFKALPQIGMNTDHCKPVEDVLNSHGLRGQFVVNISAYGQNGRNAYATFSETERAWQYKVISFNMRDPLAVERELNRLGAEGWVLHQVYSQGANNFATAAVLIRPAGELPGPEQVRVESEPNRTGVTTQGSGNVPQRSLETVGV